MNKAYQEVIKVLGVVAFSMLLVAVSLYLSNRKVNADIALGISASVFGTALMMHSLRK